LKKEKNKLEQLRDESLKGKPLTEEQKLAVNQIGDVDRQIEIAKEFVTNVTNTLTQCSPALLGKLKYVIGSNNTVERKKLQMLLEWFTPLVQSSSSYQTGDERDLLGYDIEQILDIVGPPWFFGFMSANEAKEVLSRKPYGSYLFRFSSNAGFYALSVNYGQVGHWRISSEKHVGYPLFKVDGRTYKSLYHIIEVHTVGGEPLIVKGGDTSSCYLKDYVDREPNVEEVASSTIYQTVFS